jgi:hypothetical protein
MKNKKLEPRWDDDEPGCVFACFSGLPVSARTRLSPVPAIAYVRNRQSSKSAH